MIDTRLNFGSPRVVRNQFLKYDPCEVTTAYQTTNHKYSVILLWPSIFNSKEKQDLRILFNPKLDGLKMVHIFKKLNASLILENKY